MNLRSDDAWIYPDHWAFVGGGVDPGESWRGALIRELSEELRFVVSAEAPRLIEFAWHEKGGSWILDYTFLVEWDSPQKPQLNEGKAIEWVSVDVALQLPKLPPHERGVLERLDWL
jgi:8-oxo-dGTP pyrophosphatase MutT (NUDIX family)